MRAVLTRLAAEAAFLWERLNDPSLVSEEDAAADLVARRLERWRRILGDGAAAPLETRLAPCGVALERVTRALAPARPRRDQPLPPWSTTVHQIMDAARALAAGPAVDAPFDPGQPVPFEGLLMAVVAVGRQRLSAGAAPLQLLAPAAQRDLERWLLKRAALVAVPTLAAELDRARPAGRALLGLVVGPGARDLPHAAYDAFVARHLGDGLGALIAEYPVLARLLATVVEQWVAVVVELLERLAADGEALARTFAGAAPAALGPVVAATGGASDAHRGGRSVLLLTFGSGLRLVYKPKDLALEADYARLVAWWNAAGRGLDLRAPRILDRGSHGWVELIRHAPCADADAARRYYTRAGMHLCLLYAVGATDCHLENVVAHGEHPVIIDAETLMHPDVTATVSGVAASLADSVLRTGLLPSWQSRQGTAVAVDVSGLGFDEQRPPPMPRWRCVNSDYMHLGLDTADAPANANLVLVDGVAQSPTAYAAALLDGFAQVYERLLAARDILVGDGGPLAAMRRRQARFVFRPTRVYAKILQRAVAPEALRSGVDFSLELEHASRAFVQTELARDSWPILDAELRALEQLDVPYFASRADERALTTSLGRRLEDYFEAPGWDRMIERIRALSPSDCARQLELIRGTLHAKVARAHEPARAPAAAPDDADPGAAAAPSPEALCAEARAIARTLAERAITLDEETSWLALSYLPRTERYQVGLVGDMLFDGRCGLALFLAALAQVDGDDGARALALRVVQPLRVALRQHDDARLRRRLDGRVLGGAFGLGSIVYGFTRLAGLLGDPALLEDARATMARIADDDIAGDRHFDVLSGAAGTLLGLLALHEATGSARALDKAVACGRRLLDARVGPVGARAWQPAFAQQPIAGFAHGAAGIAYALLRLHRVTGGVAYRAAALEGIAWETSVFNASTQRWADLRPGARPTESAGGWCNGAPGIGLARLGALAIAASDELRRDAEVGLEACLRHSLDDVDHLCCGNLGRVDMLLTGASLLGRPELRRAALARAGLVVARARRGGAYRLQRAIGPGAFFDPGLFQGAAGVGYALLRLAHPERLPSLLLFA